MFVQQNFRGGLAMMRKNSFLFFGRESTDENFDLILSFSTFWYRKTMLASEIVSLSKVVNDCMKTLV